MPCVLAFVFVQGYGGGYGYGAGAYGGYGGYGGGVNPRAYYAAAALRRNQGVNPLAILAGGNLIKQLILVIIFHERLVNIV